MLGRICLFRAYYIALRYNTTRVIGSLLLLFFFVDIFYIFFVLFSVALFYLFALLYYIAAPAIAQKGRRTVYVNAPVTTSRSPSKKVFRSIRSTPKEKQPSPPPPPPLPLPPLPPTDRRENKRFRVRYDVRLQPQSLTAIFDRAEQKIDTIFFMYLCVYVDNVKTVLIYRRGKQNQIIFTGHKSF